MKGIPCSEEALKDYESVWKQMDECFEELKEAESRDKETSDDKRRNKRRIRD